MKLRITAILLAVLSIFCVLRITARYASGQNTTPVQQNIPAVNTSLKATVIPPVVFENAAAAAVPSVVHIRTVIRHSQPTNSSSYGQGPDGFDPDEDNRYAEPNQQPDQMASGSGVIIRPDGYIVTNNHVVEGASELTVTLNNHKNYSASIVGTDPNCDLAVIKIEGENLPVINIGNSDAVKLGEGVLAIGYPLNLDVTVTQGIVSAKSRSIGINREAPSPVEAYIQTDAAVNPGSSGGALVNMRGELVGINSAIASPTGSFAGYAYAIPSDLVKKVAGDLMEYGSVQRGYLGIQLAPDDLDDAKRSQLGIDNSIPGLYVLEVDPSGAAGEAGIQKGDVITRINEAPVQTSAELIEQIARHTPGDNVRVTLSRAGQQKTVEVVLKKQ